jgi:hypothetical protein
VIMEWLEDMRVTSCRRSHNIEKAKNQKSSRNQKRQRVMPRNSGRNLPY